MQKWKNEAEKLINKWHNEISSSSHKINVNKNYTKNLFPPNQNDSH